MKILYLNLILLFLYQGLQACSFAQDPFCWALTQFPERNVLTGVIVSEDTTGIDFAIIEVLRGEETRDTVRIWDGTDFDCNGTWSMAAADIGELMDTFILVLPRIDSLENEWDVMGDYRRQDWQFDVIELQVVQGIANGFITYDSNLPPPNQRVYEYPYDALRLSILEGGVCPRIVQTSAPASPQSAIRLNNPFQAQLHLQFPPEASVTHLRIYASSGEVVFQQAAPGSRQLELDLSSLPAGLYLLEVQYASRNRSIQKLVKV
jgi:hypothetical protein